MGEGFSQWHLCRQGPAPRYPAFAKRTATGRKSKRESPAITEKAALPPASWNKDAPTATPTAPATLRKAVSRADA